MPSPISIRVFPSRGRYAVAAAALSGIALAGAGVAAASAQPIPVYQQTAQVLGAVPQPELLNVAVPAVQSFAVATEQVAPGTVRMWIADNQVPCTSGATEVIVAWGNITTGASGAVHLAACAQSSSQRDAVVTTGAGDIHFQTLVSGPGRVAVGSSGSVGAAPGAPFLNGNGAFAVT